MTAAVEKQNDLIAGFAEAWQRVGGYAHDVADMDEARQLIRRIVQGQGNETAVAWDDPLLDALDLAPLFAAYRTPSRDGAALKAACATAPVGFVAAGLAVAETGTLFLPFSGSHPRSVLILPPISVAIVAADRLVPTRTELFAHMGELARSGRPPAEMGLVTGPSRTGDIESLLLQGIHGPATAHALIVRAR